MKIKTIVLTFTKVLQLLKQSKIDISKLKNLTSEDIDEIFKYFKKQWIKEKIYDYCASAGILLLVGSILSIFLLAPFLHDRAITVMIALFISGLILIIVAEIYSRIIKTFLYENTFERLDGYRQLIKEHLKYFNKFIEIYQSLEPSDNRLGKTQRLFYKQVNWVSYRHTNKKKTYKFINK